MVALQVRRKQSLASGTLSSSPHEGQASELATPSEASGVQIEISLPSGMSPKPSGLNYLFEPYRGIFGKPHHNFVSRTFGSPSGPQTVIATILASPEGNAYPGLIRWSNGYSAFSLPADEVKTDDKVRCCVCGDKWWCVFGVCLVFVWCVFGVLLCLWCLWSLVSLVVCGVLVSVACLWCLWRVFGVSLVCLVSVL